MERNSIQRPSTRPIVTRDEVRRRLRATEGSLPEKLRRDGPGFAIAASGALLAAYLGASLGPIGQAAVGVGVAAVLGGVAWGVQRLRRYARAERDILADRAQNANDARAEDAARAEERLRALTTELEAAHATIASLRSQTPSISTQIERVGHGQWALVLTNRGAPATFAGSVEVVKANVAVKARRRPIRWTRESPREHARLLTEQQAEVVVGRIMSHRFGADPFIVQWWLSAGIANSTSTFAELPGSAPPPDFAEYNHAALPGGNIPPVAVIEVRITSDPPLPDGVWSRKYIFDIKGLREYNGESDNASQ